MNELTQQEKEAIDEMTDKGMEELMVQLSGTAYWPALVRYNRIRDSVILSSLSITDPFQEPTQVARSQGIRTGLYDFEEAIRSLKESVDKAEAESVKSE